MNNENFWNPDKDVLRKEANEEWKTCPVTIAAGALITEDQLQGLENWINEKNLSEAFPINRPFKVNMPHKEHEVYPLWNGIGQIYFSAWIDKSITANIHMGKKFDMEAGYEINYWAAEFAMFHPKPEKSPKRIRLPDTMVTGMAGKPMTGILEHPIFHGLNWQEEQEYELYQDPVNPFQKKLPDDARNGYRKMKGPIPHILLGVNPGAEMVRLIREKRNEVIALLPLYQPS